MYRSYLFSNEYIEDAPSWICHYVKGVLSKELSTYIINYNYVNRQNQQELQHLWQLGESNTFVHIIYSYCFVYVSNISRSENHILMWNATCFTNNPAISSRTYIVALWYALYIVICTVHCVIWLALENTYISKYATSVVVDRIWIAGGQVMTFIV